MVPELRGEKNTGGPFQSILSQGRSKEIPCWVMAQRPVHVNNMVYTENNFYCAFLLRSQSDLAKVTENIPVSSKDYERVWNEDLELPDHYARWFDVKQRRSFILKPSPPADTILDILFDRIDKAKKSEML